MNDDSNEKQGGLCWDDLAEAATQGRGGRIRPTAEERILTLLGSDGAS
jgi:hypothetical protein